MENNELSELEQFLIKTGFRFDDNADEENNQALKNLVMLITEIQKLNRTSAALIELLGNNNFKYLSKNARFEIMNQYIDSCSIINDLTKVSLKRLKKIKRTKVPEKLLDRMIYPHLNLLKTQNNVGKNEEDLNEYTEENTNL